MARPVNADADATRGRILSSAMGLFSEHGEKSSVREIARRADVSLAMVHHYFGSKDGLRMACIDAMYSELAELRTVLMASVQSGAGSIEQRLDDSVRTVFRFAREHLAEVRLMMRGVVSRGALDDNRRDEFLLPFLDGVSALLSAQTGQPAESFRLRLQSLVFLNGRYAIADENELMLVTHTRSADEALEAVEAHLVDTARQILFSTPSLLA